MTLMMINMITITLFISCLTAVSPVNLGVIVLLTAITVASSLALMSTSWFGFIIFIIYVGGMLVMFAYFAALQPNQQVLSWGWVLTPIIMLIIFISMLPSPILLKTFNTPSTTDLFSYINLYIPMLLALILFLALIMVVKTSHADEGPLRPFMYV